MSNKTKKLSKTTTANIFVASLIKRLADTVSGASPRDTSPPDPLNHVTFLHDFIDKLELAEFPEMVTAATARLALLNPEHTVALFFLQTNEKIVTLAGSKPSPIIKLEIQTLKDKFQVSDTPLRVIDKTDSLARKPVGKPSECLTVTAATELKSDSAKLILFSTAKPSAKECQLITYCLKHLEKRLTEARSYFELKKNNRLDSLTGLNNRRHFDEIIKKESERSERYHHPTSLIMLDLDYFKKVNDNFGHQTGDMVLEEIGKIMLAHVRQSDTPCRYGGEEFAVILPETGLSKARIIAERFRQAIEQQKITTHNNVNLKITASIGISSTEEPHNFNLIATADQALYLAKKRGRNQVASTPSASQPAVEPLIKHCFPVEAMLNGGL